ncbi:hypothetical protein SAY87_002889 [Trapa incisa]|uniref:Uncharacterized protein n=1 Tax=Trapa incisa TaxID=236973 RepID=A0AAN7QI98_9MYRT|nr:hypothetical protein SAY87_002889 [Trapa incisa]
MNTWEDFCQARLSPLNAQAIRGEGPVLGWPSDAQSLKASEAHSPILGFK